MARPFVRNTPCRLCSSCSNLIYEGYFGRMSETASSFRFWEGAKARGGKRNISRHNVFKRASLPPHKPSERCPDRLLNDGETETTRLKLPPHYQCVPAAAHFHCLWFCTTLHYKALPIRPLGLEKGNAPFPPSLGETWPAINIDDVVQPLRGWHRHAPTDKTCIFPTIQRPNTKATTKLFAVAFPQKTVHP